jgi:hypothetical protein
VICVTVIFTKRRWNLLSWLIRWSVPRSRFAFSLSSHCLIDVGDTVIEASMLYGVRETPRDVALKGATIVKITNYQVPDPAAGIAWARAQIGAPYDWRGAMGLGLAPFRNWAQEDKWFCFELAAGVLRAAGRPVFSNLSHIGETALTAINP